jgi:hypothetical protein
VKKIEQGVPSTNHAVSQIGRPSTGDQALVDGPAFKPDPALVIKWAQQNGADNPWDLGPKNWERCLFDSQYPGGVRHELTPESNGKLRY